MDQRAVVAADRRADLGTAVGARTSAVLVHRRVRVGHGYRQLAVGNGGAAVGYRFCADARRLRHGAGVVVGAPLPAGRRGEPGYRAFRALAATAAVDSAG